MLKVKFETKHFKNLSTNELYNIMVLRQVVFVVEQDCPYIDADGKDQDSHHVMGYPHSDGLEAYTRIVAPGVSYEEVSIGRVITSQKYRNKGLGVLLMDESIKQVYELYGKVPIRISAQAHLQKFYGKFDFKTVSEEYLEDGIPHVEMLRA